MGARGSEVEVIAQDRLPPFSEDAEAGILACCLEDNQFCIPDAMARLGDGDEAFYDLRHKIIWRHMVRAFASGKPVDEVVLLERLTVSDERDKVGLELIAGLRGRLVSTSMLPEYVSIVWDKWMRRKVLKACAEASAKIYEEGDTRQILDGIERSMIDLSEAGNSGRIQTAREIMQGVIDELENYHRAGAQMKGLPSGIPYLDKMLCGFGPGEMIVIGGRPGEGKTTLAMNVVEHVGVNLGTAVGVFSLEMTARSLGSRLLFQHARLDFQRYRTGYLENADIPKLTQATGRIGKAPIVVDETPSQTIMEIRSKARVMQRKFGVKMIVIDYFQLIQTGGKWKDRQGELAEISKDIKGMAKDLNLPVIVVAALNRESERDGARKPKLSDLREAGQLEYDADVVGLIYKPKIDDEEEQNAERQLGGDWSRRYWRANLYVAKQRNGPTGDCELLYRKDCMRFDPYVRSASTHAPPEARQKIRPEDVPGYTETQEQEMALE